MIPWTGRSFSFDLPVGMAPVVLERLRGAPVRVIDRLTAAKPPALGRRNGRAWSVLDHLGHLGDLEPLWRARTEEILGGAKELTPTDMENRATWAAGHHEKKPMEVARGFAAARAAWLGRLDRLAPEEFERASHHARLDRPFRLIDLCLFAAEHDDHHLAHATRLLRQE